jgi:hypothetical protein
MTEATDGLKPAEGRRLEVRDYTATRSAATADAGTNSRGFGPGAFGVYALATLFMLWFDPELGYLMVLSVCLIACVCGRGPRSLPVLIRVQALLSVIAMLLFLMGASSQTLIPLAYTLLVLGFLVYQSRKRR